MTAINSRHREGARADNDAGKFNSNPICPADYNFPLKPLASQLAFLLPRTEGVSGETLLLLSLERGL